MVNIATRSTATQRWTSQPRSVGKIPIAFPAAAVNTYPCRRLIVSLVGLLLLGDALRIVRIVAWFDTRENAGPEGGEVITMMPGPDGSLRTSLKNPTIASGERFGLEDTVVYTGLWQKAYAAGQRISPDALLLAEFQLDDELIDYLDAQGVVGLPD